MLEHLQRCMELRDEDIFSVHGLIIAHFSARSTPERAKNLIHRI
jgi:hypothetical protein